MIKFVKNKGSSTKKTSTHCIPGKTTLCEAGLFDQSTESFAPKKLCFDGVLELASFSCFQKEDRDILVKKIYPSSRVGEQKEELSQKKLLIQKLTQLDLEIDRSLRKPQF